MSATPPSSLERLLRVIDLFTPEQPQWTADRIGEVMAVSRATQYRYIKNLMNAGLLAPAGTPADIVNRVQQETAKAMNQPAVKERLVAQGAIPSGNTPAEFARLIDAETTKWAAVVKASGARVD